jgi:hypothetical protein
VLNEFWIDVEDSFEVDGIAGSTESGLGVEEGFLKYIYHIKAIPTQDNPTNK